MEEELRFEESQLLKRIAMLEGQLEAQLTCSRRKQIEQWLKNAKADLNRVQKALKK